MNLILEIKKTFVIARYTFIEIYKSKILLNIILLGFALLVVSYVASEFSYGVQSRIALDFGLGTLYLAIVGISIFFGAALMAKEIESRTCYMILSRPVKRHTFLLGKIAGMSTILAINVFFLGTLTICFYLYLGGAYSNLILWCLLLSFFEAVLLLMVVIFFSLISKTTMSVIYTICVFILGHVLPNTLGKDIILKGDLIFYKLMKLGSLILPNLSKFNIRDHLIYKQELAPQFLWGTLAYAVVYILFLVALNIIVFNRKQLD
ncbi:MAG: ABC transporter permease subunit [Bacteriovoracaceae bacterium]|nr:ABC transporter permease subunit [Bacteriovoracaceae bacterium]